MACLIVPESWVAKAVELPGVSAGRQTKDDAIGLAEILALRVIADKRKNNQTCGPQRVRFRWVVRFNGPA